MPVWPRSSLSSSLPPPPSAASAPPLPRLPLRPLHTKSHSLAARLDSPPRPSHALAPFQPAAPIFAFRRSLSHLRRARSFASDTVAHPRITLRDLPLVGMSTAIRPIHP